MRISSTHILQNYRTQLQLATPQTGVKTGVKTTIAGIREGGSTGSIRTVRVVAVVTEVVVAVVDGGRGDGGSGSGRGLGGAQGAARFRAVLVHELGVLGAFTLFGPGGAFGGIVIVRAEFGDGGATVGGTVASITARSLAVGDHPFGVLFTLTFFCPLGARSAGISFARGGFVGGRADQGGGSVSFTVAERAARTSAVGNHPFGVGDALVVLSPGGAITVSVGAFGFVSGAASQSGGFGIGSGFLLGGLLVCGSFLLGGLLVSGSFVSSGFIGSGFGSGFFLGFLNAMGVVAASEGVFKNVEPGGAFFGGRGTNTRSASVLDLIEGGPSFKGITSDGAFGGIVSNDLSGGRAEEGSDSD